MVKSHIDVIDQINGLLHQDLSGGRKRNLIFWYDNEAQYASLINEMDLKDAKLIKLKPNNAFRVKYMLEVESPEDNFLIYSSDPKPNDRDNWLLDILKTSYEFTADRARMEMRKIGVEDQETLYQVVKKNLKFFDNKKRVDRLASYEISEYNEMSLTTAIASAVIGQKTADFNELVRRIMSESVSDAEYVFEEVERYADKDSLEHILKLRFGFASEGFYLNEFIATLLYTNFAYSYKGKLPKELEKYRSSRVNDIVIFMDEFLSNSNYELPFNKLSNKFEKLLGVPSILKEASIEDFIESDTFRCVDQELIKRLLAHITTGNNEYDRYVRYVKERRTTHWYKFFINEYQSILHAIEILKLHDQLNADMAVNSAEELVQVYVKKLNRFDFHYRKFLYHYDSIEVKDAFFTLFQKVENIYVNSFVEQLSTKWSSEVSDVGGIKVEGKDITMQKDFYDLWLRKSMSAGERVIVIVCDGMRYEIANQVADELLKERRAEISVKPMISTVPSYTKFGMAALLPHSEGIVMNEAGELNISGINTASTPNRMNILQKVVQESVAVRFQDISELRKDDFKERFTGKKLIYIYLDTIDASAHGNSPVNAVETAVSQLKNLVRALVNHVSAIRILITADHGFIYQRSALQEYDKISKLKRDIVKVTDRRFMITSEAVLEPNLLSLRLDNVFKTSEPCHVTVPKGIIRFKTQGDEGNYTHGGAALQEIVIPVIEYIDKRSDNFKAYKVDVQLTSTTRKVTNRITYLEFFQTESVGERKLPMTIKAYFVDGNSNRISNEVMVIADSKSSIPSERTYKEKFVLKDQKYTRNELYYLVMEDDSETINPVISKTQFTIDLMIENDFGF